jgi:hypothetical protein
MKRYKLWVRLSQIQTAHTIVIASTFFEARLIGEAQFGKGNVLTLTQLT